LARQKSTAGAVRRDSITNLVRGLLVLGHAMQIYPASHKVVERHVQALARVLERCLAGRQEPLRLRLLGASLLVNGRSPQRRPLRVALLARAMRARGLEEILIRPGVQVGEMRSLATLLQSPVRAVAGAAERTAAAARGRTPAIELRFLEPPAPPTPQGALDGSLGGEDGLSPEEILRAQIRAHDSEAAACGALCGLLEGAVDPIEYERRRTLVLGAVQSRALAMNKVRAALCDLLAREDCAMHGNKTAFLLELAARVQDPEIARTAARLPQPPAYEVGNLLRRIEAEAEAHGMLAFLVRDPTPAYVRGLALVAFQRLVHGHAGGFQRWARDNPRALLHEELLRGLLESSGSQAAPVLQDFVLHGPEAIRSRLVEGLAAVGTGAALRVLALGLPYDGSSRDPAVIRALGGFKNPLAVKLLGEVLHRCNTGRYRRAEAEAAVQALAGSPCPEARELLLEIGGRRQAHAASFRGPIRRLAQEALGGASGGAA